MARRACTVVALPILAVLLGLTTSVGADWVAICEVCDVDARVELSDDHACKTDDAHRKRYVHRCSCSASTTCRGEGVGSSGGDFCFPSEEVYRAERDQVLSTLERFNAHGGGGRVDCDIGPCRRSGCTPGQKGGGGLPSRLAAADKFGESMGDIERLVAPFLLGQRPNALNKNPAYENWLALRDGGKAGGGPGLYDPKKAKRQAQDRAGWKNSRPAEFGLSDWNRTQDGYRVPEPGGKVGKDTLAGWGQPKAAPSSGGVAAGGNPSNGGAAEAGKGSKVSEPPVAEQAPAPKGRGESTNPVATGADKATAPKPPGSGPTPAEGRELNRDAGVKDKSAADVSRDTGNGERGVDPALGRRTPWDRGGDISDLEREYGRADKAFNRSSARGTGCVDGGNCAPDEGPSLYQSIPRGKVPDQIKLPTKVEDPPQPRSPSGGGRPGGRGGGRGGGAGGGTGGSGVGGGGATGGGGGKTPTVGSEPDSGPRLTIPAPAPPALAKAPAFSGPIPRPPEARKQEPRPERPIEQPKKERRFVPDPAINRMAAKLNHLPPKAIREAGRIQRGGAAGMEIAGGRASRETLPAVPEEPPADDDEADAQEAESEIVVEQTDCPKADALMDELRLEEALEGYRACLFTDGRERPGAPRWALYQAITGAVRWMKKPPALVREAKDKLQGLSRSQGGRQEAANAERTWQRILWLAPWWPDAHYGLAIWHEERRESEESLLRYRVFLEGAGEEDSRTEEVRGRIGAITRSLKTELGRASVGGRK